MVTFAGNGGGGGGDGTALVASFNYPRGIAVDQRNGDIYVTCINGHTVRKITQQGEK